jgi:hypothetical protein
MSSPTDHNKILAITHLVWGVFSVVVTVLVSIAMLVMLGFVASESRNPVPIGLFTVVMILVVLVNLVLTLPSFVAGYGMLQRKRWAKPAGIVAAIIDGLSFPFGTALCVYTLWFIFSEQGRQLYDNRLALPPSPPAWNEATKQREFEYIPPVTPPDWR